MTGQPIEIVNIMRAGYVKDNKTVSEPFGTPSGLGTNASNLDYALSELDGYDVLKEIIRGHPFVDGNKRTVILRLLKLQALAEAKYTSLRGDALTKQVMEDFAPLFEALSKV